MKPFQVVKDFEYAVAVYTGAPYVVAVNSCTNALFLCIKYHYMQMISGYTKPFIDPKTKLPTGYNSLTTEIEIPKRTYVSVPQQILHAGYGVKFRDEDWEGVYQLKPFPIWDAAKRFTSNMWSEGHYYINKCDGSLYMCTSHHWQKILGIQQGGCILHNDPEFDKWARKARFDGRTEGVAPKDDNVHIGWHMYMSPEIAAEGIVRLSHLPKDNPDRPTDDYPDLSKMGIFK